MLINSVIYGKRGTGKTQAILQKAKELMDEGKRVLVICLTSDSARGTRDSFKAFTGKPIKYFENRVSFGHVGQIIAFNHSEFDCLLLDVEDLMLSIHVLNALERDGGFTQCDAVTVTIKDTDILLEGNSVTIICDKCKLPFSVPESYLDFQNVKCPFCAYQNKVY